MLVDNDKKAITDAHNPIHMYRHTCMLLCAFTQAQASPFGAECQSYFQSLSQRENNIKKSNCKALCVGTTGWAISYQAALKIKVGQSEKTHPIIQSHTFSNLSTLDIYPFFGGFQINKS